MCGIFGIITNQAIPIGKIALEGIKRLEYRGYDSCGIVTQLNGKLHLKKDSGKIKEIDAILQLSEFPEGSKLALAHTRWATHGAPTKENSHPHLDCEKKVCVVHNGIIENFMELQRDLIAAGIPQNKIFLDYAGFRTLDSMVRAKKIFGQNSVTVISQKFHNERAIRLADYYGIKAVGYNAKAVGKTYGFKTNLREKLARVKVIIDFIIGTKPHFLGEKITIQ